MSTKAKNLCDDLDKKIAEVGILGAEHKAAGETLARLTEEHDKLIEEFTESPADQRRLRESRDALLIAEGKEKKLRRQLKAAMADLIYPANAACVAAQEALASARAAENQRVLAAVGPLFEDPRRAEKVAATLYTDRRHQLRGGIETPSFRCEPGQTAVDIARSVLGACRGILRRVAGDAR